MNSKIVFENIENDVNHLRVIFDVNLLCVQIWNDKKAEQNGFVVVKGAFLDLCFLRRYNIKRIKFNAIANNFALL